MNIQIEKHTLPTFWACPLLYGDMSGLEDDDIKLIENWCKDNPNLACVDIKDDHSFIWNCSAIGNLGCDCSTFVFHKTN